MSTCDSAITAQPNSTGEFFQPFGQDAASPVNKQGCHGAVMRENFGRRLDRVGASFRECWRRMRVMHAEFERSGDGTLSRERSEERLRDEDAWSRMNDEGCPNATQHSYPRQDIIREERDAGPDVPARRL